MNVFVYGEYAEATTAHISLSGKLEIAVLSKDIAAIAALTPMVEDADTARSETRAAMRNHESIAHQQG